ARRHVRVRSDMAEEFGHEALAELHHFVVALALGIKIRAALAAAHGERGQGILQYLLEGKEFQNAQVYGRMEAESALIGSDGAVHLDAESAIYLDVALIVDPGDAK